MELSEFQTPGKGAVEGLTYWNRVSASTHGPVQVTSRRSTFSGRMRRLALPGLTFSTIDCTPAHVSSTQRLLGSNPRTGWFLLLNGARAGSVVQSRVTLDFAPATLVLIRTDLPFEMDFPSGCDARVLRIAAGTTCTKNLTPLSGRVIEAGEAPLMTGMLGELERLECGEMPNADLLRGCLIDVLELTADRFGASRQRLNSKAWFDRFAAYVRANVGNPAINAELIARRFDVSSRFVHKVFAEAGLQTSGFIHDCRLDRAYGLVLGEQKVRISDIAARSGYSDFSYFCRQFKRRFGVSASQARRASLAISADM